MLKHIIYLFFIAALMSCDTATSPNEIEPSSDFFPLSIGNYWEYEESFSSEDTSYVNIYTSTRTKIEEKIGYDWFKIESEKDNFTEERYLTAENDSIYELQPTRKGFVRALQYIIPKEDKQTFGSWLGGDVGITITVEKLDTIINTKIGDFRNCFRYNYSSPDWTEIEIIAFGIGVIEKQFIGYGSNSDETFHRIEKIIDAKIN